MKEELKNIFRISDLSSVQKRYLLAVIFIGIILRVGLVVQIQDTPFSTKLISDSKIYDDAAQSIGDSSSEFSNTAYFMAPAYPYFLYITYSVFTDSHYYTELIQVLFSSLTIFFVFIATKRLFGIVNGLIAATITSLCSELIFYSGIILSETLQVFFISFIAVFIVKEIKEMKNWEWFIIGLLTGIAALFRGNILLFPAILIIYLFISALRGKRKEYYIAILSVFFGIIIIIAPVTIRNYVVSNDLVILTSNGGINFYLGNNPDAEGVFKSPSEFDFRADMSGKSFAEINVGKSLKPSEVSSYWVGQATSYITSNPIDWLGLMLKKGILFFDQSELPQSSIMDSEFFAQEYTSILRLPLVSFLPVFILFVFGVYSSFGERKNKLLLLMLFISFALGSILFFVNGRYRLGILPVFIIYSSVGFKNLAHIITQKDFKKLVYPSLILACYFIISTFVINKPIVSNYDAYIELGNIELENQNYDKALLYFNRSLTIQESFQAYSNIGNAFAMKGQYEGAINFYQKSLSMNSKYALTHFNLGMTFIQLGDLPEAIIEFKNAIEINPRLVDAYRNLGIAYYMQEDYQNSLIYFNKFMMLSDDEKVKESVRQDIEQIRSLLNQ